MISEPATPRSTGGPMEPVVRRLQWLASISDEHVAAIQRLGHRLEQIRAGSVLSEEGSPVARPRFIVSGWAARHRLLPDGRRQVFSVVLPGEGVGICAEPQAIALSTTVALTKLVAVDATSLLDLMAEEGREGALTKAVSRAASIDESRLLDHIVRLGRQTAYERTAHLLLELCERQKIAGIGSEREFPVHLTQELLADMLGLSSVHVNRTLQQLRRDRLIKLSGIQASLMDVEQLTQIADYRPPRFRT